MRFDVYFHFEGNSDLSEQLDEIVYFIKHYGENIMTTLQDVQASIAALKQTVIAEKAEVKAKLDALSDQVQELTDQIANGGSVTPEDLTNLQTSIAEISTGVQDISETTPA